MSPQRSNRSNLIEGTLRCLERLPASRVTTRAIAEESGANLASIVYHFGSKDALVTEASITGLDRWLDEVDARLDRLASQEPAARLREAAAAIEETHARHRGLARTASGRWLRRNTTPGFASCSPMAFGGPGRGSPPCSGSATTTPERTPPGSCSRCFTAS